MIEQLPILLLGGFVGAILGLTGAGGSIIAVPLLIFGLHLTTSEAAPIALLAVCSSTITGAVIGLRAGDVRYRAASLIAIVGILVAPIGVWSASKIPNKPMTLIFTAVLIYVAVSMLRQVSLSTRLQVSNPKDNMLCDLLPCQINQNALRISWNMACARALALTGAVAGFLSGLLGVGGGFVVVPALKKYSNVTMTQILPTSLAVIALISSTGVLTNLLLGKMNWDVALPFAAGSLLGMLATRTIANRFSASVLQHVFAIFAILVALGLIFKVITG